MIKSEDMLAEVDLKRGFYTNGKTVRFLYDIGDFYSKEVFIGWVPGKNVLKLWNEETHTYKGKISYKAENVETTNVYEWFRDAKYLGFEPTNLEED